MGPGQVGLFVVLAILAIVFLLLLVYPYFIYPRVLARLPRVVDGAAPVGAQEPSSSDFALLFCAYNERSSAEEKAENLRELVHRYPDLSVLVYDDGSSDGCGSVYSSVGENVQVVVGPGRMGKARGMKTLVGMTARPFLVFTDANVILDPDAIDRLRHIYRDPAIGGVCGHLVYEGTDGTATEEAGQQYWSLDERLKQLESMTGSVMGGDGSIFSVRRELYPTYPDTVQDDFTVTMSVVFSGRRLVYAEDVIARERLVSRSSEEYRRKVRIAARAYHTHLMMRDRVRKMSALDRWKYSSHKVLRWLGGGFALGAIVAGLAAVAVISPIAAVICAAVGIIALLFGPHIAPIFGTVREILLALMSTLHGLVLGAGGKTFATWNPPQSR